MANSDDYDLKNLKIAMENLKKLTKEQRKRNNIQMFVTFLAFFALSAVFMFAWNYSFGNFGLPRVNYLQTLCVAYVIWWLRAQFKGPKLS
ncbi:MAG TPA: hypothetical protein VNU45_05210 [Rummeliibacillus sp.]|nr:hypothetical protein [Rummeliibacillus sp.]